MAKIASIRMTVPELIDLRDRIDQRLHEHRADIERQLSTIEQGGVTKSAVRRSRSSPLRGVKVPAKYRGGTGETWSGRGARPRWLVAALRGGKRSLEDFLIDKPARKTRRKRKKVAARKQGQVHNARKKKSKSTARKKHQAPGRKKQQASKAIARKKRQAPGRKKQQASKAIPRKKQQKRETKIQKQIVPTTNNQAVEVSEQRSDSPTE
jgi:DNA-binding protein H-NS